MTRKKQTKKIDQGAGDRVKILSLNNGGMSLSLRPVLIPDPLLDLKVASNSGDTT